CSFYSSSCCDRPKTFERLGTGVRQLIRPGQEARFVRVNHVINSAQDDADVRTNVNAIVKVDHVARAHTDAAETGSLAEPTLLRRAVDIDATVTRAAVLRFHASQPDDASDDRVPAGGVCSHYFSRRNPVLDHCARRQSLAELCGNKQSAQGR